MRPWTRLLCASAFVAALAAPSALSAQGLRWTTLNVTGFPLSQLQTSVTDYDAGFVSLGVSTFTVDLLLNFGSGGFSPRRTTVNVRCASPCPASGPLSVTGLQWRRATGGAFVPLTTSYALVESRVATYNGANDPWSNDILWRYALNWATTAPTAVNTVFNIEFQLVVTAP